MAGSRLTTSATALINLIINFAITYPGAALPPKIKVRGGISRLGLFFRRR